MSFFDGLERFVSDLQKSLKPEDIVKLRSCKKCSYYKQGYCTQTSVPTKILSEHWAQGCLRYSPQEAVIPTPRLIELGQQKEAVGLNWFDRNPLAIGSLESIKDVSGHAAATRTSYTCPKGRIAMIEFFYMHILRVEPADPLGRAKCYVRFTPKYDEAFRYIAWIELYKNGVGDQEKFGSGSSITMFAGDVFEIRSLDMSTGGVCSYATNWKGTEFDV